MHLAGDLNEGTIAAVLSTGETYAEIEQALKWIGCGREEWRLDSEGLTPRIEEVCDILLADPLSPTMPNDRSSPGTKIGSSR